MFAYLSIRALTSSFGDNFLSSSKWDEILFLTVSKVFSRLVWAPPKGSFTISSTSFCRFISVAVSFRASAACSLYSQLLQRMEEQDSGDMTEYQVFSNMRTL